MNMISESYATETSLIRSLLKDLESSEAQAYIEQVAGCTRAITELQAAHDDFHACNTVWDEEKANASIEESASEIRKRLLRFINGNLVLHLNAMTKVDSDTFGELSRIVGEIIGEVNRAVAQRSKKKEEEKVA